MGKKDTASSVRAVMQVYLRKDIEAPLYRHHKLIVLVKLTKFTWNCLPRVSTNGQSYGNTL